MSPISEAISTVKRSAERIGLGALAREAGVPYTTVKSFADRGWAHKNFDILERLLSAAGRVEQQSAAGEVATGAAATGDAL